MDTHTKPNNRIRCAYCPWTTLRFRGKKTYDHRGMSYGERQLRHHVLIEHEEIYLQRQGLAAAEDSIERAWTLDITEIGEQAL